MELTQEQQGGLNLVIYMMIYISDDIYSDNLFRNNFCENFKHSYTDKYHKPIQEALSIVTNYPEYDYSKINISVSQKYSNKDIYYYLCEFNKRIKLCTDI
jgi:hypothetical protein